MNCKHNILTAIQPEYTGIEFSYTNTNNKLDIVPEYFMYKRYKCETCGKIVVILHAIILEVP